MLVASWSGGLAGPRDEDLFIRPEDQHIVMFGSLDAGRSVFVSGGSKQTVTGPLDRSGFVIQESSGYGLTRERSRSETSAPIERLTYQASTLVGYQWALPNLYAAAYLGPELRWEQVAYGGRIERLSRPHAGVQLQYEVWSNPTPGTLFTATAILGSANMSVWSRVSTGLRFADSLFVGPELTVYATPTYSETRWGAHVTTLKVGIVELRLSGGWLTDAAHSHGSPYGGVSAWFRL